MKLPFIAGTKIVELESYIDMEPGAPCPIIIANDYKTVALFIARDERDYNNLQQSDDFTESSYAATFDRSIYHRHGTPNDEALYGHPYRKLGLNPYGFFEVMNSDLIETLKKINSIHPEYRASSWNDFRHFIITFKESMFECVAMSFEIKKESIPPLQHAINLLKKFD